MTSPAESGFNSPTGMMRTLVLGGAGNFGSRIVRALNADPRVHLISAGRSADPVPGAGQVETAVVDINQPQLADQIRSLTPDLVIHCVGPFQDQDYRVAQAALESGAHYMDLADGRNFVTGFSAAMHDTALQRGRTAISGVSTLPALSSAVVDAITADFSALHSVQVVIAPGQLAPRGAATIAAVFSYLGRPIDLWRDGHWQKGWGWMDLRRFDLGFGSRWGALCDVPDLAFLPQRYPELKSASLHAALEIRFQHLVLWGMAALRRSGLPLPVQKWAASLDRLASLFDCLAGQWGGMQVIVEGSSASGAGLRRTWTLKAPAMNGPETPCMAAILLARRMAGGERFPVGAFPCMGFLELSEFEPLFAEQGITTRLT